VVHGRVAPVRRGTSALAFVLVGCAEPAPPGELRCGQPGVLVDLGDPADLEELAGCTTLAGSLRIGDSALADVDGLDRLRVIDGTLNFFRNPGLVDLHGLRNLESVGGEVLVHHNPELASLSDLERLHATGGLLVSSNANLTQLDLDRLATVTGDLRIISNPALPQTDAEQFASGLVVTGAVDVSDNAP